LKRKLAFVGLGVALLLAVPPLLPLKASGQGPASEAAKRQIRTRVEPEYPPVAKEMNLAGKVKIEAKVAADGHVLSTRVMGGSPIFVNAVLDALKKWRFEPAPKDTTETVEIAFNPQD
jgi:periplasmic protein TonB